ncbi:hypothetical protein [Sinorhizobium meliloti]|uniref:hypothetical protein n=1 Tax=Rhizobium meliloti TaxID=382 RepID=UPI001297F964|nr:hypothetical protein [Sinorhizobium meliloti]MQW59651.1 hypothetical protein [Sinorhizobium meliloti]
MPAKTWRGSARSSRRSRTSGRIPPVARGNGPRSGQRNEFRQEHAASKAATGAVIAPEPISPDRADELSRLLALPDARSVSAEQMAYGRKVVAEADAVEPEQKEQAA